MSKREGNGSVLGAWSRPTLTLKDRVCLIVGPSALTFALLKLFTSL